LEFIQTTRGKNQICSNLGKFLRACRTNTSGGTSAGYSRVNDKVDLFDGYAYMNTLFPASNVIVCCEKATDVE
jgi:hypothetical protein